MGRRAAPAHWRPSVAAACLAGPVHVVAEVMASGLTPSLWASRACLALLVGIVAVFVPRLVVRRAVALRRLARGHCGVCGYDLLGVARCPECGSVRGVRREERLSSWLVGFLALAVILMALAPVPYVLASPEPGNGTWKLIPRPSEESNIRVWYRLERTIWASSAAGWWDAAHRAGTWRALRIDVEEGERVVAQFWYDEGNRRFALSRPAPGERYPLSREAVVASLPAQWGSEVREAVVSAPVPRDLIDWDSGVIHPTRSTLAGLMAIWLAAGLGAFVLARGKCWAAEACDPAVS